jgi:hypothetical protein
MTDKATARLVRGLPRTGAVVVVHDIGRRREVERAVREHSTTTAKLVVVRVVTDTTTARQALAGVSTPIVLDAPWCQHVAPNFVEHVKLLVDCAALYPKALAGLAR